MIEHLTGQEFKDGEVIVHLDGRRLERVLECHAGEHWATLLELDYRTNQPIPDPDGGWRRLRVQGKKLELFPATPIDPVEENQILQKYLNKALSLDAARRELGLKPLEETVPERPPCLCLMCIEARGLDVSLILQSLWSGRPPVEFLIDESLPPLAPPAPAGTTPPSGTAGFRHWHCGVRI